MASTVEQKMREAERVADKLRIKLETGERITEEDQEAIELVLSAYYRQLGIINNMRQYRGDTSYDEQIIAAFVSQLGPKIAKKVGKVLTFTAYHRLAKIIKQLEDARKADGQTE